MFDLLNMEIERITHIPVCRNKETYKCYYATVRRHRLYEDGRDNSVDSGIFIHTIVPRHVETVAVMVRDEAEDINKKTN